MFRITIPAGTAEEYLKLSVKMNRKIVIAVSWFAILVELFNIIRVLFFTNSRLGTLNNRIYFGFYLFLLVWALAYLVLERFCRKKGSLKAHNILNLIGINVFVLWHSVFNVYDVHSSGEMREILVVTAIVAFAALLWMRPLQALGNIILNYLVFMILLKVPVFSGTGFNFTVTVLLACLVYMVRFQHICEEAELAREMEELNRKLQQHGFWLTREQYELISRKVGFITFQWDVKTDRINLSKEWEETFGLPTHIDSLASFIWDQESLTKAQKAELFECMKNVRRGKSHQTCEMLLQAKDGEGRWFKLQIATQTDEEGLPLYGVGMLEDVMDQKEKLLQLEHDVQRDVFTGILNKAAMNTYGQFSLERMAPGERLAMMIFDLDDFKRINDQYGHPVGDYVLQTLAGIMRENALPNFRVGRLGGDEFAVIAAIGSDESIMNEYARHIMAEASKISWNGQELEIQCSVGMAVAANQDWTYFQLYREADQALYEAKRSGKKRICVYWNNSNC